LFYSQNDIIHRDFKPANILMHDDQTLKIADFGLAFNKTGNVLLDDIAGTIEWMSPKQAEVFLKYRLNYNESVALGVICYEFFLRYLPLDFGRDRKVNEANMLKILQNPAIMKTNVSIEGRNFLFVFQTINIKCKD
jgi:serine/threonine protein kinase